MNNTPAPSSSASKSATSTAFVNIAEYSVKFPSQGLPPIQYKFVKRSDSTLIQFSSATLKEYADARDSNNGCGKAGTMGILMRQIQPDPFSSNSEEVAIVDGQRFVFTHVQNPCSQNADVQKEQERLTGLLINSLKQLSLE
jgi:hypothetical protein